MAENQKYNLKDELLEADRTLTGSNSLIGMTIMTQVQYNSGNRSNMDTAHLRQALSLVNPDFPRFYTGGENTVGKFSSGYKSTNKEYKVFRKVVRYYDISDHDFFYILFLYDEKNKKYEMVERKTHEDLTEVFGYEYNNDVIDSFEEGDIIPAKTVLYKSHSYDESMNYRYGKNYECMQVGDLFTAEDACIVSETMAKNTISIESREVTIGLNQNEYLLNLYGDDETYKTFPDIGEYSSGVLCAKRVMTLNQLLTDFKDSSLRCWMESDTAFFVEGQVVDITIYCNNDELAENDFTKQIMKYMKHQRRYYKEIRDVCREIINSGDDFNKDIEYLYKRACEFLDKDKKWKDSDSVFGNLLITMMVRTRTGLRVGQKITGRYGNKSVISKIVPDDEMPFYYDDLGNKHIIHLLTNKLAVINRNISALPFELSCTFYANKAKQQMILMKQNGASNSELFKFLEEILANINPKQAGLFHRMYHDLNKKEQTEFLEETMDTGIYICHPPMWEEEPIFYQILKIEEKYDWYRPYDIYINKWGREIKTLNPAYVGEMYIMKLKQTATKGFSVRGMGPIDTKGLPSRNYKNKTFTEKYSSTPIRFGEFETLNFAIAMMPEDIQLFHLLYRTSSKGRRELAEHLLSFDDKFKFSKKLTSRTAEIFNVLLKSLGLEIEFVDEDEEKIQELDNTEIKEFVLDGKNYLTTEYSFMLIKRRKKIEEIIHRENPIIDKEEFKQKVFDMLKEQKYLVGPAYDEIESTPEYQPEFVHEELVRKHEDYKRKI